MEREARESAEGWVVVEEMIGGRREGARWQADRDQLPPWSAAAESGGRQEEAGRAAGMAAAETAAEVMARAEAEEKAEAREAEAGTAAEARAEAARAVRRWEGDGGGCRLRLGGR